MDRDGWAQLALIDCFTSPQQQTSAPEGCAPAEGYFPISGYAPAESQESYIGSSDPFMSPFDGYQPQETHTNSIEEDSVPEQEIPNSVSSRKRNPKSRTRAAPKEPQPKSKRAERREAVAREHQGEVSATDQPKGLVEWQSGIFKWWDPEAQVWLRAAYHDEYRDQFIEEDAAEGSYQVAPERGTATNDVTSFCSAFNQAEWRLQNRESWDNIVDADSNKVLYLLDRPASQSHEVPERLWIHDGCVLLDEDKNPVRPWSNIPRCFSSKIEGGRMEALRRILPLTIQDFRARMPRYIITNTNERKPLYLPSTFGHRSSRFRDKYQCPAWTLRAASEVLKRQVKDLLPEAESTTEGLPVLSRYEIERRKSATRGQYLYKAVGRLLTEGERKKRERKLDDKLARQGAKLSSTSSERSSPYLRTPTGSVGGKRSREDDDDSEDVGVGPSGSAAKRGRWGPASNPRLQRTSRFTPDTLFGDRIHQTPNTSHPSVTHTPASSSPGHSASNANPLSLGLSNPQTSTLTPSSTLLSTPSPTTPSLDYRTLAPTSPRHHLSIEVALFYPRAHYRALTGRHPPPSHGTYNDQYHHLSASLVQEWTSKKPVPVLADVGPWSGGFDAVPVPKLDEGVLAMILNPEGASSPHHHDTQIPAAEAEEGGTQIQTPSPNPSSPEHESDGSTKSWDESLFGEYISDISDDCDQGTAKTPTPSPDSFSPEQATDIDAIKPWDESLFGQYLGDDHGDVDGNVNMF